jgi:hypothetical protein
MAARFAIGSHGFFWCVSATRTLVYGKNRRHALKTRTERPNTTMSQTGGYEYKFRIALHTEHLSSPFFPLQLLTFSSSLAADSSTQPRPHGAQHPGSVTVTPIQRGMQTTTRPCGRVEMGRAVSVHSKSSACMGWTDFRILLSLSSSVSVLLV